MPKFGKLAARRDPRTLKMGAYLAAALPPPPAAFSILPRVEKATKQQDPKKLFPIDGNDSLGDCTIAAAAHAVTVYQAMCGKKVIPPASVVRKTYFGLSGGEDKGLVELDVLNYWRKSGIAGDKLLAYVSVQPHNRQHVQQAINLFGAVYLGFQVQQDCISDFHSGKPWTPGPLLNEGHAVLAVAYGPHGIQVLTWGSTQWGTWEWWDECVDEAYALLPAEASTAGFAPGVDLAALQTDLAAVTG